MGTVAAGGDVAEGVAAAGPLPVGTVAGGTVTDGTVADGTVADGTVTDGTVVLAGWAVGVPAALTSIICFKFSPTSSCQFFSLTLSFTVRLPISKTWPFTPEIYPCRC